MGNTAIKRNRPKVLKGVTHEGITGCGPLYLTINKDDIGLFEVFVTMGKAGGCAASQCEAIGRIITLALRYNIPAKEIIKQLSGISCHSPVGMNNEKVNSCADAIGKMIKSHIEAEEKSKMPK